MTKKILLGILFSVIFISSPSFVEALTVSPQKMEFLGEPGDILTGEIRLVDTGVGQKRYFVSFENFESKDDSGKPHFVGSFRGLATWLLSDTEVFLREGEEKSLPFSIAVPIDAKPGGYFATIFFEPQTLDNETQDTKIGVLIFLRVEGEMKEGGRIISFSLVNNKRITSTSPFFFEYRFKNEGDDRIIPKGRITVFHNKKESIGFVNLNENGSSVLPGSFRRFESTLHDSRARAPENPSFFQVVKNQWGDFKFGLYTATISVELGENGGTDTRSYKFFILPWQIFISFAFGLAVILYVVSLFFPNILKKIILSLKSLKKIQPKVEDEVPKILPTPAPKKSKRNKK